MNFMGQKREKDILQVSNVVYPTHQSVDIDLLIGMNRVSDNQ